MRFEDGEARERSKMVHLPGDSGAMALGLACRVPQPSRNQFSGDLKTARPANDRKWCTSLDLLMSELKSSVSQKTKKKCVF